MPRSEYFRSGQRRCGACDATLKPAEPANMLGNLVFGVPLGLSIFVLIAVFAEPDGPMTMESKLKLAAAILAVVALFSGVAAWAWPFGTPFEASLWQCWNCRLELVHHFPICPRCNAPSRSAPTKPRAARVIPSGSGESPATSGSA